MIRRFPRENADTTSPGGKFHLLEKDPNHFSSLYGDFVDSSGRIVRAGVSMHIDAAPSGTHFQGAAMKWFMRLTDEGVGMHVGILPGYPASHGCIRMPSDGSEIILRSRQSRHSGRGSACGVRGLVTAVYDRRNQEDRCSRSACSRFAVRSVRTPTGLQRPPQ